MKFQLVIADEIIHRDTGYVELPGGRTPLYEVFKALERDREFYFRLKETAEKEGIPFLCSPFGLRSAAILKEIGVNAMKIASPEINHIPLLREIAAYNLPVLLSTGVSTLGDIEEALEILGQSTILLHCITQYPAPEREYNLSLLPLLSKIFGVPTGLSDHSLDPVLVPLLAYGCGAVVIEKHFTLSREGKGLDDPIALDPESFGRMTGALKEAAEGSRDAVVPLIEKVYGKELVHEILGTGVKGLAPSERENYATTNRSIHALTALEPGEKLSERNMAILRSEKNLRPGLHPRYFSMLIGKRIVSPVSSGEGILWENLLGK